MGDDFKLDSNQFLTKQVIWTQKMNERGYQHEKQGYLYQFSGDVDDTESVEPHSTG